MARVLVGVTGGIAAYKACDLVRLFVKGGHEVVPLVTPGAERFVRAETFFALARQSPSEDLYVHLTRADLLVVAPLTANTLAKLAHGLADNLVAEAALAHRGPVLLAPAMNPRMWAARPPRRTSTPSDRVARCSSALTKERRPRANGAWAGWRSRKRSSAGAASCSVRPIRSPAAACSSAQVGPVSRSTRCGSSGTAPRGGWAWRSRRKHGGAAPR